MWEKIKQRRFQEMTGEYLHDLEGGKDVLDKTQKHKSQRKRLINRITLQIRLFFFHEKTLLRKRQAIVGRRIEDTYLQNDLNLKYRKNCKPTRNKNQTEPF